MPCSELPCCIASARQHGADTLHRAHLQEGAAAALAPGRSRSQ